MSTNTIRSIIIDDDPFIRDLLQDKLRQYLPEIVLLGTADSGNAGLQLIKAKQPDLVFLDVEMTDMTGFEMLARLESIQFQTIFITSYSHYAIKAIRFNALDYLVKPIDLGELKNAIKRYRKNQNKSTPQENLKQAVHNFKTEDVADHKLVLQTQEGELRLVIKDIIRIEAERNYSNIFLKNGKKKLVTKTLADLEELLEDKGFFRSHRTHLINGEHITGTPKSASLVLSDGAEFPISRRKKKEFQLWFENYQA